MRIGIISDIHGDYDALQQTLDRLETVHQVDRILCAGDLIGRGPEENRVVELIRERNIVTVKGNHDVSYYEFTDENREFLNALPIDWQGEFGGFKFFMCHGKPGNNMWGMYRDHLSKTYLNMVLKSLDVDILITGHTHVPLHYKVKYGCLLNPGSLYTFKSNRVTSHSYGVLTLPEVIFEVFDSNGNEPTPERIKLGGNKK